MLINFSVLIRLVFTPTTLIETVLDVKCVNSCLTRIAGEKENTVLFILLFHGIQIKGN